MTSLRVLWVLLVGLSSSMAAALETASLVGLLEGEFNNGEQVWQQRQDEVQESARFHWKWQRLGNLVLSLAVAEGQSADEPQWLVSFREHEGQVYSEVIASGGGELACTYLWVAEDHGFLGSRVPERPCDASLPRAWQVDGEWLRITPQQDEVAYEARRAIRYTGWIVLARSKLDPGASDDDYVFLQDIGAHDQGTMIPILDEGIRTGYAAELVQLTYQNSRIAVLKLGIIDEATGETLSYSWAEPGAGRIGINLRWIQGGFTRVAARPASPASD